MQTLRPVRRTQAPAIAWTPAHDPYYVLAGLRHGATATFPIHVTQSVLLELEAQLADSTQPLPFGLLAGGLYSGSQTRLEYLLVDYVRPSGTDLTPEDPRAQIAAELRTLAAEAKKRGKLAVGWYIGGIGAAPQLDAEVDSLHRELFPEPWQVVLVHDASDGTGNGAFMRFEGVAQKYYAIPFFEALSKEATREKSGLRRTAVRWANYLTTEPVSPLSAPAAAEITAADASASPSANERLRQWLEPLRRALYGAPATQVSPRRAGNAGPAMSAAGQSRALGGPARGRAPIPPPPTQPSSPPAVEDEVQPEADRPTDKPAEVAEAVLEVPAPATHQVFFNGELITFTESAADDGEERRLASQSSRRRIMVLALAALALLLAIGILVLAR